MTGTASLIRGDSIDPVQRLAMEIHARRLVLGLSVRAAAAAVGIPPAVFNRTERGINEPRLTVYLALSRWLDETEPKVSAIAFEPLVQFS